MKYLVLSAWLAALPVAAAGAPFPLRSSESSPPEWTLEVTSYGEESRDLTTLFVPYFAGLNFAPSTSRVGPGEGLAFFGPGLDVVTIAGRFNCVIIRYNNPFSGYRFHKDPGLKKRAEDFRVGVLAFLASLPEPRPSTKDLDLRSKYCSRPADGATAQNGASRQVDDAN
jgi:hypothetical protein